MYGEHACKCCEVVRCAESFCLLSAFEKCLPACFIRSDRTRCCKEEYMFSDWRSDVAEAVPLASRLAAQSTQAGAMRTGIAPAVLRVFQMDASRIDVEVARILSEHVASACSAFGDSLYFAWHDELSLVLQLVLFKLGIWDSNQSFGDSLQNVVYRNERAAKSNGLENVLTAFRLTRPTRGQLVAKLALSILLPYVVSRVQKRASDESWAALPATSWRRRLLLLLTYGETCTQVLAVANTLLFLALGKHRSIVDWAVGLRLVYGRQRMAKVVNLSYLLQQLRFNALFSMMSVVLPLLNLGRLWSLVGSFRGQPDGGAALLGGSNRCPVCAADTIALPRRGTCGCTFCYYCIASRLDGNSFSCPRCGQGVSTMVVPAVLPAGVVRPA